MFGFGNAARHGRLGAWAAMFATGRDVLFDLGDPLPFLAQWRGILHYICVGYKLGISTLTASTYDIDWNGEAITSS